VHGLGSMTFGLVVQKFLNIKWFFHWKLNWIKLNHSWNFWRNWNVSLVLLERSSSWAGFKRNLFDKDLDFRMWELYDF
jgi:hypothetical protein